MPRGADGARWGGSRVAAAPFSFVVYLDQHREVVVIVLQSTFPAQCPHRTFHSYSHLLRTIAVLYDELELQHCTPRPHLDCWSYEVPDLVQLLEPIMCEWPYSRLSPLQRRRLLRLLNRYRSYCEYRLEIEPQWVDEYRCFSIEDGLIVVQRSARYGARRRVPAGRPLSHHHDVSVSS